MVAHSLVPCYGMLLQKLLDRTEGFVGQVETQRRTNWDNPDDENEDKEEKEREETSIA